MRLYEIAKSRDWKPWELQSALKKEFEGVVSVGDDLSFTIKLTLKIQNADLEHLGGRRCSIYPFKNAYRFEKGFLAFNEKFLRVSRDLDREKLEKILDLLLSSKE